LDRPWCLEVSSGAWRIGVVAGNLLVFMPLSTGRRVSRNVRIIPFESYRVLVYSLIPLRY
jgi:hypothetical protein